MSPDHFESSLFQPWNQPFIQETLISFSRKLYLDPMTYFFLCTNNTLTYDSFGIGLTFSRG